ncbi:hypothetical protein EDC52_105215 [Biostraticola tofi]|uniref:Uncharacterized protein n=1 Tax=Biostraticola tofi TaxID=466109 RepID=A0A4R3YT62_9GAMM|nr:hypothetical protein EDC52_105215 [Biostraticola tofi]
MLKTATDGGYDDVRLVTLMTLSALYGPVKLFILLMQ